MMVRLPLLEGAVQLTVATPSVPKVRVLAVALTDVGAPGLVAAVVTSSALLALDALLSPNEFVLLTVKV